MHAISETAPPTGGGQPRARSAPMETGPHPGQPSFWRHGSLDRHAKPEQAEGLSLPFSGYALPASRKMQAEAVPTMLLYRVNGELSGVTSQIREDVPAGDDLYFSKVVLNSY